MKPWWPSLQKQIVMTVQSYYEYQIRAVKPVGGKFL